MVWWSGLPGRRAGARGQEVAQARARSRSARERTSPPARRGRRRRGRGSARRTRCSIAWAKRTWRTRSSVVPRGLHGYGDQSGNSRAIELVDRLDDLGDLLVGRAPGVDPQARLLVDQVAEALHVRAVGRGVDEPLQPDVLVGPDRPARPVAVVDVELVGEDLVALLVALGVAGVDRAELADPDRRARSRAGSSSARGTSPRGSRGRSTGPGSRPGTGRRRPCPRARSRGRRRWRSRRARRTSRSPSSRCCRRRRRCGRGRSRGRRRRAGRGTGPTTAPLGSAGSLSRL